MVQPGERLSGGGSDDAAEVVQRRSEEGGRGSPVRGRRDCSKAKPFAAEPNEPKLISEDQIALLYESKLYESKK
ncbi:MAG: hypothetical protein O2945_08140 [Planctomycetota bacterium]|nr:hypothetical protein [Planctomycetota bacterium]MDA0919025.1 hypothetical protein [Planctomycetota bacterium]